MKRRNLTTIVVATSLMLPMAAFANAGEGQKRDQEKASPSRAEWKSDKAHLKSAAHADFQRVDRESLESKMTAQELIGKTVVGSDGQRLGAIHDIGFAHFLPSEFQGDAKSTTAQDRGLNFYVAVGGVLGVGADIVSVPAERFGFDQENDHLTLDVTEDQFTAIAKPDTAEREFASSAAGTTWTTGPDGTAMAMSEDGLTGARTDVAATSDHEDVELIEKALKADSDLNEVADDIRVTRSGDAIVLSGDVPSESQKHRIVELARSHTDREVRDQIRTEAAAE